MLATFGSGTSASNTSSATTTLLARAIAGYARDMGVDVVAEGIETAAELRAVAALGAYYGQGFHLGRPRPLAEQRDRLAGRHSSELDLRYGEPGHGAPAAGTRYGRVGLTGREPGD